MKFNLLKNLQFKMHNALNFKTDDNVKIGKIYPIFGKKI